jgi:hypothetical protein
MPKTYTLYPPDNSTKKYKVYVVSDSGRIKKIQFGAAGMSDYTKHKDKERKERYINRHKKRENWNDPTTAGFWSLWVLWNLPTVKQSLEYTKRRFKLKPENF